MSRLRRFAAGLALGLYPFLVPLAHAWTFTHAEPWPDGPVPIAFGITPAMPTNHPVADWENAVRTAAAAWNGSLQRIQLEVRPTTDTAWYENGQNEVFFDQDMFDDPFPTGVLAVTAYTHDRGTRVETDIVVNRGWTWSMYAGPIRSNPVDLRRVLIHELGHFLGLDHPDEAGQGFSAIMNSSVSNVDALTADDLAGARALYDFGPGVPPLIVIQPGDTTAKQGVSTTLRVVAGGRGPLHYEWSRNGVPIPGATAAALTLAATRFEDVGDYRVAVTNAAGGVASRTARLTVSPAVPPSGDLTQGFFSIPKAGEDVSFSYSGGGDLPRRYEWRKNGAVVPGASGPTLLLEDVQGSDAGTYTLTVSNAGGSHTTQPRTLTVLPAAPLAFSRSLSDTAVASGAQLSLLAPVYDPHSYTYQWRKNGVNIPGATAQLLSVANFAPEDAGKYSVVIASSFGQVTSNESTVTFYGSAELPLFSQPGAVTAEVGQSATLYLETYQATLSFQWYKDGVVFPATAGSGGSQSSQLSFPAVTSDHAGVYSVEVSDGRRRVRSHGARLAVLPLARPAIVQHPAAHTVTDGAFVNLTVHLANYNPVYRVQWLKDGVPLAGAQSYSYSFTARAAQAGRYRARITAGADIVESDEVEVQLVPGPRLFAVHPASRTYDLDSTDAPSLAFTEESKRNEAERTGQVYFYSRDGQRVATPFLTPKTASGVYTLTIGPASAPEVSRPFTLTFASRMPGFARHPRGGTILASSPVTLDFMLGGGRGALQWYRNGIPLPGETGDKLRIARFSPADVGDYTVAMSNSAGRVVSEPARLEIHGLDSPLIVGHPAGFALQPDQTSIVLAVTTRADDPRYQWYRDGVAIPSAQFAQMSRSTFNNEPLEGAYYVVVRDGQVAETSQVARVLPPVRAPAIVSPPVNEVAPANGEAVFSVGAIGAPPPDRYQWYKDGVAIPGAIDARLRLRNVQAASVGVYTVVVSNALGSVTSGPATLAIDGRGRLVNLATRARVGRGDDVLIAGFTLNGTKPRQVLVRGIGDQLSEFGVSGVLRDPVLKLFDSNGKELASNDDWFRTSDEKTAELAEAARQVGAFAQRTNARDATLLQTLAPGSYTAQVSGLVNTTGVGLVEIYELGQPGKGRLINLSSRAVVGTDANILIPGLVLQGAAPRRLLIRAVGPRLAALGVPRALADPQLKVLRSDGQQVGENNNWGEQAGGGSSSPIAAATTAVGGFPLTAGSKDAAVLLDLPAGNYTIQVSGVNATEGIALVEVYEVP